MTNFAAMNGSQFYRNPWIWLGAAFMAVLLRGLWLDVMDVDASASQEALDTLHNVEGTIRVRVLF